MFTKEAFVVITTTILFVYANENYDTYKEEFPSTHKPRLLSEATKIEAVTGESVTFPCDVEDLGDYVLLWKRDKNNNEVLFALPVKVSRDERIQIIDETSLHISGVLPKDSGDYTCQISTSPTTEVTHSLNVLYPPDVKPRPLSGEVEAKEGQKVVLACDATGNPEPRITWKHAGRNYGPATGKDYVLHSVKKSEAGEYECIADNGIGEAASTTITVNVVSAPKITPQPESGLLRVKEGEPVSMSCKATGDPTPVISWRKPDGGRAHSNGDNEKIFIPEASRSHAGSYECTANNSLGISTTFEIKVEVLYPPEIEVPVQQLHTGEGTSVELTCIVHGEPVPTVTWKKDDEVIHSNEHYHIKTVGGHKRLLQVHHMKESDFGQYQCLAESSLGSTAEIIDVMGTPKVPSFTSKPHGPQGMKYTLQWKVESHSPVDTYSLRYKKKAEGEEWVNIEVQSNGEEGHEHTQTYQLTDLMPDTAYEAVIMAHNKFGWSEESENFHFRTKPDVSSTRMTMESTVATPIVEERIVNSNEKRTPGNGNGAVSSCHVSFLMVVAQVLALCILRPLFL